MARSKITGEEWERAKEYFEHGLTLSEIEKKTGISRGAISKKSKSRAWDKESPKKQLLSDAIEVSEAKETLKKHPVSIEVHEELLDEKTRHKTLIYDNATKLAGKINTMADQIDQPQDMKHLVDANDKLAVTLKVADRHAPKCDVNVQTSQTIVDQKWEIEFVESSK